MDALKNMRVDGAFIYFEIPILGGIRITQTTISSLIVTIILCTLFITLGRNLKKRPGGRQVLLEKGVGMLRNMVVNSMGEHNAHWTPFIGTIFLSSLFGTLIGLTGFLRSTTADVSCVAVWAIMVSVIIWYNNIKHKGFLGFLKGFTEPIVVMTPMNIVSEIAQPVAMAFRHFGNVAGGGVITTIIYTAFSILSTVLLNLIAKSGWLVGAVLILAAAGLVYLKIRTKKNRWVVLAILTGMMGVCGILQAFGVLSGVPAMAYGIPAVLSCYFDLFSGFVQAYVFSLLTMVYIAGSIPAPEQKTEE